MFTEFNVFYLLTQSSSVLFYLFFYLGQRLPPSYSDPPIEIPSRVFQLSQGPAVFPNHPDIQRHFREMGDMWSKIFCHQRRLQALNYIEARLPHWLRLIAEQPR